MQESHQDLKHSKHFLIVEDGAIFKCDRGQARTDEELQHASNDSTSVSLYSAYLKILFS